MSHSKLTNILYLNFLESIPKKFHRELAASEEKKPEEVKKRAIQYRKRRIHGKKTYIQKKKI
ncbi:Uncharacterised protein [Bacillus cereus]|nr:Uncharacterised protein [Bacillus cereus]